VRANEPEVLEFRVPVHRAPEPEAHTLNHLSSALHLPVGDDLLPFLAGRHIQTLGDIRRAGGLGRVDGLPVGLDDPAVRALEEHADLSRLSPDVESNAVLIEKGFRSVADIAGTPLPDFVSAVHETIGDYRAANMQVVARAQTAFLKNVLTDLAVARANGFAMLTADPADPAPAHDPLPERCNCDDCEAAVSPAAYLADLLGYAATHLKENGKAATLVFLENTFHQPFGDLPTDCEAVEEHVRQVRICIEVLRAYIKAHPLTPGAAAVLETATREYLLSAYALLLIRFGTSYEEIRLARGATREERHALADRLGIDLTEPRPNPLTTPGDELDQLFLDPNAAPDAAPPDPPPLTELALERLFGLVDTTRDPLSDGVKIGDNDLTPVLAQWRFAGAIWSRNTDKDGLVYIRVKNFVTNLLVSEVEVYRNSARTVLVAAGQAKVLAGNRQVRLVAKNASGLSGSVTVSGFSADNTDVSVALFPKLLLWRLRNLRTIWRRQDFPIDVYSADYLPAADRRPIVDPDVIGPDDFRRPDPVQPLFALWRTRRLWIDRQLQELVSLVKTHAVETQTFTVPDLDKVFARMYVLLAYAATSMKPWLEATPVSQFDALGETLERGATADVSTATERLAQDLNLSVDAFVQVVRIRAKQRQWESDPKSEMVQPEEWSDLFSILVRAQKERFFPAWIQEEVAMRLGPEDFWRAQREPREGDWPPVRAVGQPLIDPDKAKLTDLPEPTIGKAAIQLWHVRRAGLIAETAAIKNKRESRESNGFDAMLLHALGHPASGNPLQHDLAVIKTDLTSSNPDTVTAATEKITQDLHLTVESFNRVRPCRSRRRRPRPGSRRRRSGRSCTLCSRRLTRSSISTRCGSARRAQLACQRSTGERSRRGCRGCAPRSRKGRRGSTRSASEAGPPSSTPISLTWQCSMAWAQSPRSQSGKHGTTG
jgi:hypothetical protein